MTESEQLAWSSHLPALLACIGATTGPVLELGIGHFSTPALHALCGAMKRHLTSRESSMEWFEEFKSKYKSEWHHFYVDANPTLSSLTYPHYGVAFIDNSPGGKNRADCFAALLPVSEYVVCHDYHLDNEEHIGPLLAESGARYHVTQTYQPPTLVASLTRPIPESILCL